MTLKVLTFLRFDWPLHFIILFCNVLPDNVIFLKLRGLLISFFVGECGKNLRVGRCVTFYNSKNISIGDNVYIAYGNWFNAQKKIRIGDEVLIGPYNVIVTGKHSKLNDSYRYGQTTSKPIIIEDGAWITSHCTITGGSIIGRGKVVSANSLIKQNNDKEESN